VSHRFGGRPRMKAGEWSFANSASRCRPIAFQRGLSAWNGAARRSSRYAACSACGSSPVSHTMTSASARIAETS